MGITQTTVTEALAELKTLGKRIEKKQGYIAGFLARQEGLKDPLEKDGGSAEVIRRELQGIGDLNRRRVNIRIAIQQSNHTTMVTIGDTTRTVAEWLTWRKEIAPDEQAFVNKMRMAAASARDQAQKKGWGVVSAVAVNQQGETKPTDIVINVDEGALAREAERLEEVLGTLDGKLSLLNATTVIPVEG